MSTWTDEKIAKWLTPVPILESLRDRWLQSGFSTMLDRGCGPGRHSIYFASAGFSVSAIDQSSEALEYLTKWAEREQLTIDLRQGDILDLPYPDNTFDCVLDYHASFHTATAGYKQGIQELWRALRPGGEAYITIKSKHDMKFFVSKERIDQFTILQEGKPHFYVAESEIVPLYDQFSLVAPVVEIQEPEGRIHYHILIRRD